MTVRVGGRVRVKIRIRVRIRVGIRVRVRVRVRVRIRGGGALLPTTSHSIFCSRVGPIAIFRHGMV